MFLRLKKTSKHKVSLASHFFKSFSLLFVFIDSTMEKSRSQTEDNVISWWLFIRFKDFLTDGENRRTKSILHSAVHQIFEEMG